MFGNLVRLILETLRYIVATYGHSDYSAYFDTASQWKGVNSYMYQGDVSGNRRTGSSKKMETFSELLAQ